MPRLRFSREEEEEMIQAAADLRYKHDLTFKEIAESLAVSLERARGWVCMYDVRQRRNLRVCPHCGGSGLIRTADD